MIISYCSMYIFQPKYLHRYYGFNSGKLQDKTIVVYETSYKIISYLIQKIVFKKHLTTLLPYIALCILKNPQITSLTGYTVGTECPFITKTEEVTDINKGRKQNLNSVFDSPQCTRSCINCSHHPSPQAHQTRKIQGK